MSFDRRKIGWLCLTLAGCAGLAMTAAAAPGQKIDLGQDERISPISAPLQLRNRGGDEIPKAGPGFEVEAFAKSLGDISAMAIGVSGEIYVVDQKTGRLIVVTDRDLDGRMDVRRVLATDFQKPSGLVYTDQGLYVSDERAIWHVNFDDYKARKLAALTNVQALSVPRPLALSPDQTQLILALSTGDKTARLISVDRVSGKAAQIASGPGPVTAMAMTKGSPIWLGIDDHIIPVIDGAFMKSQGLALDRGSVVENLYLPTSDDMTAPNLKRLSGQFLAIQGGERQLAKASSGGRNLVAVPSSFGAPQSQMEVIIDGFVSNHGRASWGEPKAVVWDRRGLFLADRKNGMVWKISKAEPKITFIDAVAPSEVKFYKDDEVKKPKAKWGSSIAQGSTLITGSAIGANWEEDKVIPNETLMEKIRREEAEEREAED